MAAVLAVVALAGIVPLTEQSGQVIVLNPESYPLVGGTWSVELDIRDGGPMIVSAVEGTAFGKDIEFAGLYGNDGVTVQVPLSAGHDGTLHFGNVPDGAWTFEVDVITLGPHHLRFEMGGNLAHADNTASLASVTSNTTDGAYGPGTTVDVWINFTDPVTLRTFPIQDSQPLIEGLSNAQEVLFMQADGRHYAVVADQGNEAVRIVDVSDPDRPDPSSLRKTAPVLHLTDL